MGLLDQCAFEPRRHTLKKLKLVTRGSHLPTSTFYLMPKTTPEAVLKTLKLEYLPDCYVLTPSSDPASDLFEEPDLYKVVEDGQTLLVLTLSESAALTTQAASRYAATL
jgi:hypothetical protein